MEAAGIEPGSDFDATENGVCNCENCEQCRAAYALHEECFKSRFLATLDVELLRVLVEWGSLAAYVRGAIIALLASEKLNVQCVSGLERNLFSEHVQR
jgi:hypothetical protein